MYFYKAVPTRFLLPGSFGAIDQWDGIQSTGLDPSRAGCIGGATSRNAQARSATHLDRNYTWVSQNIEQARNYASTYLKDSKPVILQIVLPDFWATNGLIVDHNTAGWGTTRLIPPLCIYFEAGRNGHWIPIEAYSGTNAYVADTSDSDDEW
jgi:hypothetical protein